MSAVLNEPELLARQREALRRFQQAEPRRVETETTAASDRGRAMQAAEAAHDKARQELSAQYERSVREATNRHQLAAMSAQTTLATVEQQAALRVEEARRALHDGRAISEALGLDGLFTGAAPKPRTKATNAAEPGDILAARAQAASGTVSTLQVLAGRLADQRRSAAARRRLMTVTILLIMLVIGGYFGRQYYIDMQRDEAMAALQQGQWDQAIERLTPISQPPWFWAPEADPALTTVLAEHPAWRYALALRRERPAAAAVENALERLGAGRATATGAAFAPDLSRIAAYTNDGKLLVWEAATGAGTIELRAQNNVPTGVVKAVAFSPDGHWLTAATVGGNTLLWTGLGPSGVGALTENRGGSSGWLRAVAFAPDNATYASGGDARTIRVMKIGQTQDVATLSAASALLALAFAPSGQELAAASDAGRITLWDLANRRARLVLPVNTAAAGHDGPVLGVAYSPDGTTIATAGADQTVRLWDARTGELRATLSGHTDVVRDVAFSIDGRYLTSASADGTARVWDAHAGESGTSTNPLNVLQSSGGALRGIGVSADGKTVMSFGSNSVNVWSPAVP